VAQCGVCCTDVPCEEVKACGARAACYACRDRRDGRDDREARYWRISLARQLTIGNRPWWRSVKVCLTANNACRQICVDENQVDTPLGTFGCDYRLRDFDSVTLAILARNSPDGPEERIAEKHMSFGLMNARSLCTGLSFTDLVARKDTVGTVVLQARVTGGDL
jgi:hypothetical protein